MTNTNWQSQEIPHSSTNAFSSIVIDYLQQNKNLSPFYNQIPSIKNFASQIKIKQGSNIDRYALEKGLQLQYTNLPEIEAVKENISLLGKQNTYTICTAHQPIIFTGPLYFIYKILHTVKLCKYLKEQLPENNYVPIFYIGEEDADLEEIGTTFIGGKKTQWVPLEKGASGRMSTSSLANIWAEVQKIFDVNTLQGKHLFAVFSKAYTSNFSLGEATLHIVHSLLGQFGVVCLRPDNVIWKQQMIGVYEEELTKFSSHQIVTKTNNALSKHYVPQAFSREVNLFYLQENSRERIEWNGKNFEIINTNLQFSQTELLEILETNPERFSPNVILRGLLQETILPNIGFVGGGGELAYWLQLKDIFSHYKVPYPILVLRQSISILSAKTIAIQQKFNLPINEIFTTIPVLQKNVIDKLQQIQNFIAQKKQHEDLFAAYNTHINNLPTTFQKSVEAHFTKSKKIQERLQHKIIAAYKKKETESMQQLTALHNTVFTNNTLQERIENFIPYYLQYGDAFFNELLKSILPFGNQYLVLQEPINA